MDLDRRIGHPQDNPVHQERRSAERGAWEGDAAWAYARHVQEHGYPRDVKSAWCLGFLAARSAAPVQMESPGLREAAAEMLVASSRLLRHRHPSIHLQADLVEAEHHLRAALSGEAA